MSCKFITITPDAENTMCWIARVSNPINQDKGESIERLLTYCIKNGHWSVFEQASMSIEICCERYVSAQILRHRSFTFQEFSQRYSDVNTISKYDMNVPDLRLQARKNRQSSVEMTSDDDLRNKKYFQGQIAELYGEIRRLYNEMLFNGIAKECARAILPLSVSTVIIMTGSVRSWIHYIQTRCDESTQKEHRQVALECRKIFCEKLPIIAKALNWCG